MWLCACLLLLSGRAFGAPLDQGKTIAELLRETALSTEPEKEPAFAELLKRDDTREGAMQVILDDETPEMLGSAVLVLGHLGKRGQKDLKDVLSPKSYSPAQLKVLRGLGVIGAKGVWLAPGVLDLAEHGLQELSKRLKDSKAGDPLLEMRTNHALTTLGLIGGDSKKSLAVIEKFLALKVDPKDGDGLKCQMDAATALWRLSGAKQRALEVFGQGLESGTEGAVQSAIYGLGEMGEHAIAYRARLTELLSTASVESKASIQSALDKIDGKQPIVGPKPLVK
jgi:hypothetical protein